MSVRVTESSSIKEGVKRFGLTVALAFVVMLILTPGTAYAAKVDLTWSWGANNMNVTSDSYDSVAAINKKMASSEVGSHIWIKLEEDFGAMPEGLRLPDDKTVMIYLNGHVLGRELTKSRSDGYVIKVGKNTKLTIQGGDANPHTHIQWSGKTRGSGNSRGGVITGGYSSNTSGGIEALKNSCITLDDVTIAGCASTTYGGGIRARGGDITISLNNSHVKGCYSNKKGGGIYADNSGFILSMAKSSVTGNYADDDGGGIATDGAARVSGNKSSVSLNRASDDGGGFYCVGGNTTLVGLNVENNEVRYRGAGLAMKGTDNRLSQLVIRNNKCTTDKREPEDYEQPCRGGGVWSDGKAARLESCVVEGNSAYAGGGVFLDEPASLIGSLIIRNNYGTMTKDLTVTKSCFNKMGIALTGQASVRISIAPNSLYEVELDWVYLSPGGTSDCTSCMTYEVPVTKIERTKKWQYVGYDSSSRRIYVGIGSRPVAEDPAPTGVVEPSAAMECVEIDKYTDEGYRVSKGYARFPNTEHGDVDSLTEFFYTDGYFALDPKRYNPHLATTSLVMAMSGFYLNAGGSTDYTNKHASARQFMASIGCEDDTIYVNDLNVQKPQTKTIGVTIANKTLKDRYGQDTDEILVPVVVRGGGYEAERASSVTLGDGTDKTFGKEAQGYAEAAGQVLERIEYYLKDRDLSDRMDKVRFWVVGYSRAGAVANLVGKRLVEAYGDRARVFGYTFEAPQGGVDNAQLKDASAYHCIHNVINYADVVPLLGPSAMGFKRYGVDHFVPGNVAADVKSASAKPTRAGESGVATATTFYDNTRIETKDKAYAAARDKMKKQLALIAADMKFDDYFKMAIMDTSGLKADEVSTKNNRPTVKVNEEKFIRDFMEKAQEWGIGDRGNYAKGLQGAMREVMRIVFAMSEEDKGELIERERGLAALVGGCGLPDMYAKGIRTYYKEKNKAYWQNYVISKAEQAGAFDYLTPIERQEIKRHLPKVVDLALTIVSRDYNTESYKPNIGALATFGYNYTRTMIGTLAYNYQRIMMNSYPEVNLAWLRSYDSYYDYEDMVYALEAPARVAAPVARIKSRKLETEDSLDGKQQVTLEVEGIKGEAIYYKLTKNGADAIVKPACANGYEIYRAPLDLSFGADDTYSITAYAMWLGKKSPEVTFTINGRSSMHEVNIATDASEIPARELLKEGSVRTVRATVADQRFFKAWEITDEKGADVSGRVKLGKGQTLASEAIDFTMPEGGRDGLSPDYALNVRATFVPLADAITVKGSYMPVDDSYYDPKLPLFVPISYHYNGKDHNESAPAHWSYKNVEGDYVNTSIKYRQSDYRLEISLGAAQSKRFVEDVRDLKVGFAQNGYRNVKATRGQDRTITITADYTTGDYGFKQPPIYYDVTIEHCDYNTKKKLARVDDAHLKVEATSEQQYVLDATVIEGASFKEWVTDAASGIEVKDRDADVFKVTDPKAHDRTFSVRAYYVPVVSAVSIQMREPQRGVELDMEPTLTYTISDKFGRPDGYEHPSYPPVSAKSVEWYDDTDTRVTGVAGSEQAYHAKVTPEVWMTNDWQYVFADDVTLGTYGSAEGVWDHANACAIISFPHTQSTAHKVVVMDAASGLELGTYAGYEGSYIVLEAPKQDGKVFRKWGNPHYNLGDTPDRQYATEVPDLTASWTTDDKLIIRVPGEGESIGEGKVVRKDYDYTLWVDATYVAKRDAVDIALPTPGSAGALELAPRATASIVWPTEQDGDAKIVESVRAAWSRTTEDHARVSCQTYVYGSSDYSVEVNLSKRISERLARNPRVNLYDDKDAGRKWKDVECSWNHDGTLSVRATYTTDSNDGMMLTESASYVTVNVVAADVNDRERTKLKEEMYEFYGDETEGFEFVVPVPDIKGAVLDAWEVTDDNLERVSDDADDQGTETDAGHFRIRDLAKLSGEHAVSVCALMCPVVDKVAIEMEKPEAGSDALPDKSKIRAHLTYANSELFTGTLQATPLSVVWTPEVDAGKKVAFNTEYVADLAFGKTEPDVRFAFDDHLDVIHVTDENLTEDIGTYIDYGYNVEKERFEAKLYFEHSDMAKLIHVDNPEWIQGVESDTDIAAVLPTHADIVTTDPTIQYAEISWTAPEPIEDGTDEDGEVVFESVWKATGTVRLPDNVLNPDGVDLGVETLVVVNPPADDKVAAEVPYATLEPGEYATEQSFLLDTEEVDGTIFYSMDGVEFKQYAGESIELTKGTVDSEGVLFVFAYTAKEGKKNSPTIGFAYGLSNYIEIPHGETHSFNGDLQTGVIAGTGYVLEAGEGVTIDEDGNACARNVGTYTVTAKLKDGFTWLVDDEVAQEEGDAQEEEIADVEGPEFIEVDGKTSGRTTREDQTITFEIVATPMEDVEIDEIEDQGYTGHEVTPDPVVSIDGNVLEKDVDYTLEYANNRDAGTATVKVLGRKNVDGEATATFQIKKITITYNGNGSDVLGRMAPTETGPNVEKPLAINAYVREGWVFNGWNDRADGTGEAYHEGEPVKFGADVTLYAQWTKKSFVVAAYSRDEASTASVADIRIDPASQPVEEGTRVSVTAPAKRGWAFVGWYPVTRFEQGLVSEYDDQMQLSNQRRYSFTVKEKTEVVAIYRATGSGNTRVTVNAVNGARYTIARDGVKDPAIQQGSQHTVRVGTVFSITAEDAGRVVQWLNGSGKVMGTGQDTFAYTVTGEETISLVYNVGTNDVTQVRFMNDYDQVLLYRRYPASFADANLIEMAQPPSKLGYTFKRWVFEGTDTEATRESILAKVRAPEKSYAEIVIRPQYEKQDVNYVVSVSATGEDGTNELVSEESYHAGDAVTLVAPAIDGMVFESWRDEDGKVLGHTETCMLYVTGNRNLFAHYVTEGTAVERVPVITINGFDKKVEPAGGHKVQCVMSRCVPDGYELVEHGVLYGYDLGSLTEDTFVIGAEGAKRFVYKRKEPINAAFLNMAVNSDDDVVFFRAYMTVKKSGSTDLVAYYSDIEATSFNSING